MSGRPYDFDWEYPSGCFDCRGCHGGSGCLRMAPEAIEKIRIRDERARVPDREETVFDRECHGRQDERDDLFEGFSNILKETYAQWVWKGTYAEELLLRDLFGYKLRCQRLRGGPYPKKDDIVQRTPQLRGMKKHNWLDEILYDKYPFFALLPKRAL